MRERESNKSILALITPPLRVLGSWVGSLYKLLFGWYSIRLAKEAQLQLEGDARKYLSFLFVEHQAQMLPTKKIRRFADIGWPTVIISTDNLLLTLRRWRGESQAYVAPVFAPDEWHELSTVLSVSQRTQRQRLTYMEDIGSSLKTHIDLIESVLSKAEYDVTKQRLVESARADGEINQHCEERINKRLYGS